MKINLEQLIKLAKLDLRHYNGSNHIMAERILNARLLLAKLNSY